MRAWKIASVMLALCALVGCASQGAGVDCDPCASAEANPTAGGAAAAAAARGGQQANQAPYADDTARLAPQVTIGRGGGDTRSQSQDSETRHVVSGGAQNNAVLAGTEAHAQVNGGHSPSVMSAQQDVTAARNAWLCAVNSPCPDPALVQSLRDAWHEARKALHAAESGARVTRTYNYRFDNARINQIPFSSSSSDGRPDAETVTGVAEAAETVGTAVFSDEMYESASPPPEAKAVQPMDAPPTGPSPPAVGEPVSRATSAGCSSPRPPACPPHATEHVRAAPDSRRSTSPSAEEIARRDAWRDAAWRQR